MEGEEGEAKIINEYVNDFASWGEMGYGVLLSHDRWLGSESTYRA